MFFIRLSNSKYTSGTEKSVKANGKEVAVIGSSVTTCNDIGARNNSKIFAAGIAINMPAIADPMKSEAFERERKAVEEKKGEEKKSVETEKKKNPYSYLEDGPDVGVGKNFTAAQKQKMLEENMKRNGGVVKSDNPNDMYQVLKKPKKSQKGVTPAPDEWQFDHIIPKDKGGTNSFSNCQIVSRKFNRQKWNK